VIADAQGIGRDRERRIDGAARWEEARIDHVKIVDLMSLAVAVERGGLRVVARSDGLLPRGAIAVPGKGFAQTNPDDIRAHERHSWFAS
jgi:hypothetical protein